MFKKYQHVERFGTDLTSGINIGTCHIFPKLDGSNGVIWLDDEGAIHFGSRNRELSLDNDNQGFMKWGLKNQLKFLQLLERFPPYTYVYGEWLAKHTIDYYQESAWKRFWVFDIRLPDKTYVNYDVYSELCQELGIDYIPCLVKIKNPSVEKLTHYAKNTFLVDDDSKNGEGIVVKNYEWSNKHGRVVWAKLVNNTFKTKHLIKMGGAETELKLLEEDICNEFITQHSVDKVIAKIRNQHGSFSSKNIPQYLGMVYYDLVTEELWNALKKYKNPTINFKTLNHCAVNRAKELKPEIFGV